MRPLQFAGTSMITRPTPADTDTDCSSPRASMIVTSTSPAPVDACTDPATGPLFTLPQPVLSRTCPPTCPTRTCPPPVETTAPVGAASTAMSHQALVMCTPDDETPARTCVRPSSACMMLVI